jgi:hypothetical protein
MAMWDEVTEAQREALIARVVAGLAACGVPDHLRGGLVLYLAHGILPGGFLQAVLCNDLQQAIARGDPVSLAGLPALTEWLTHYAPAVAWGSVACVRAWTTTPERLEL